MSEGESQKNKILLVDDDEFLVDMYSVKFEEEGFRVDLAMDGKECIRRLRKEDFDILLLDLVMPAVDGFEVLDSINEEKLRYGLVVIVLSNQGTADNIEKARDKGIDVYIVKANAVPSEVVSKVKEIAENSSSSGESNS